uniref:LysR family transcriptional regulator n=1 Tax=Pararhizobium sp. IMCC3301 TaxID=3067904 RepID=UPI0027409B23|nr:LysR family transcriptional regulator [Pararhizobium sp. IMCC3301]
MSYVVNVRMFVRVFELGNMSAAARDLRVSAAVASSRIAELEKHLGVRLFNRTTRRLQPTEHGKVFYAGASKILETIEDAEAAVVEITQNPRGSIFVAAPLGVGRRFIAPHVPSFKDRYPEIDVRLRMSDRKIDMAEEGLDVAFVLGHLQDSNLKARMIAQCKRVLCAAPNYIRLRGHPAHGNDLINRQHDCLQLRFPGTPEFRWLLQTPAGPAAFDVSGPFESDDGDVLTQWALEGHGIVNKPVFEVVDHLQSGALVAVAEATPPVAVQLACLYPHRTFQDPKIRLFIDFMIARCRMELEKRRLP